MKKQIPVEQLNVGMYLEGMAGSWLQHPFLRSKFVIKDPNDIRLITGSGIRHVWIDTAQGDDVAAEPEPLSVVMVTPLALAPATEVPPEAEVPKPASMSAELARARKIMGEGKRHVVSMFQEARMGRAVSPGAAAGLVEEISDSVSRNPGAIVSLARLKTADDYTYLHSVAACALMVSLARALGLDAPTTRDAGMAGLMHDLGKAMMPMEILNKPGKLTDAEFAIIKSHPERGHALLVEGGGASAGVRDVCLHHHEKIDGSGYPQRLKGAEISLLAKMGAICDVYDAITSNRPYKAGWDPAESIRKMTAWCNGHFDEVVFRAFVKSIGIYPVGSLVKLASGRLAVVIEQSVRSLVTPVVKVMFSSKAGVYLKPEVIDLSRAVGAEKIVSIENPEKWGISGLERFWAE
jgi:HD-GYP domain-containing protein (c-di-GMP phosphodiesterase class II)